MGKDSVACVFSKKYVELLRSLIIFFNVAKYQVRQAYMVFNMCMVITIFASIRVIYTAKAVVIDNHLPRQPLISSYVPD